MHFITPYLLTYLCFFSFAYLIGMYAFIHQHLCDLYQISKTELGFYNGMMSLVSTIGVVVFLMYTIQIKARIVTFFTWGSLGLMFPYTLIVFSSLVYGKSPKIYFYVAISMIGVFRSIFIQSLLIMIKMHKEIYDKTKKINEHNYKLLTNVWSASYGMVVGFFVCNWLQYTVMVRWEYLVLVGISLKLAATTLLFFGLRGYLEGDETQELLQDEQPKNQPHTAVTFSTFFSLVNNYLPSKLFLINSTILDSLHIGFCYALPVFFYDSGYKGNEGYLTAIYSLSIIAGAYAIAISDYFLHVTSQKISNSSQDVEVKEESKDKAIVLFIFSVSLFFFVVTLFVLAILSFQTEDRKRNGIDTDSNVTLLMILMCALGFFFGGPLKSYFSYKTIKAMKNLEGQFKKRMKYDLEFKKKEEKSAQLALSLNATWLEKISGQKLQVGSSLITTNRILTYCSTVVVFTISFFLIEKYLSYTMVFFWIIALIALIFDIIQNWVALKEEQKQKRLENGIL